MKTFMDFSFKIKTGITPEAGRILIAEPLLPDPHFQRGVVYLCSHNNEGSFGFILNKPLDKTLDYFIETLDRGDINVYLGGPVDPTSIHFLHKQPALIGGDLINDGIYMGGDFSLAISSLQDNKLDADDIVFFVGYSGWGEQQLNDEIDKKSWLVSETNQLQLFDNNKEALWENSILALDKEYHVLTKLPKDPSLN
jgi:putative transcriptional regulator